MFPELFEERMRYLLADDEYNKFMTAFDVEETRHKAFRFNYCKTDGAELFDDLDTVPWEDRGRYYSEDMTPGKHPYHEAGLYYIQEPSAMAPAAFLDPQPGDRVLDLCAAPGGKTTQLADRMNGEGILIANEINRDRAKILSQNVERLGIKNALVLNEDSGHLSEIFEGYFSKILVDAPCSGEGMFRKNDNAADEWSLDTVQSCAKRQEEILDNAAKMLLPGGRLVYSTCTFSPEENEENVSLFLSKHPDFKVENVDVVGGMEKSSSIGSVRLWPHKVRGEGHFFCVFRRDGKASEQGQKKYVPGGKNIKAKREVTKTLSDFIKSTLDITEGDTGENGSMDIELKGGRNLKGIIINFGDQLYLVPEDMPSVKGLKVLRPGLHLGSVKKDRFEPSHAFALWLRKEEVKLSVDFSSESNEIRQYLNGQTLRPVEKAFTSGDGASKGWCLVTTDGYSIGWGKLAGGVLKNHYPKGIRINY